MTFAEWDAQAGLPALNPAPEDEDPLSQWQRSVYHTPFEALTVFDVGRACRQKMALEYIVPIAVEFLDDDVTAGQLYPGELLAAVGLVPTAFWSDHLELAQRLPKIVKRQMADLQKADISDIAKDLLAKLPD